MIERYHVSPPVPGDTIQRYQDPIESCEHSLEIRKLVCSNGAIQFKKQCTQCGKGLTAIAQRTLTRQEQVGAPLYDSELQANVRHAAWEQRKGLTEAEERACWQEWYNGYLNSAVWRRRRKAVLDREHRICQSCKKVRATRAHHLTYANVGAEPLFELVAVCTYCHKEIHNLEVT